MAIEAGHVAMQAYPAGASDFVSTLSRTLAAANRFPMTRLRDEGLDRRLRGVFDEISAELVATQMVGVSLADFDVTRDTLETMRRNFDAALAVDTSRKGDER